MIEANDEIDAHMNLFKHPVVLSSIVEWMNANGF
jgi:hypothetical protein